MLSPIIFDEAAGLWLRPGSGDYVIAAEYLTGAWSDLDPQPSDVVLDLGGNVGSAAKYFLSRGAQVFSYEPDPDSFRLLRLNAPSAICFNSAVASVFSEVWLSVSKENPWESATAADHSPGALKVSAASFSSVLSLARPTVIKCDIEGGEFDLDWSLLSPIVRKVAIEVHDYKANATKVASLEETLRQGGFTVGPAPVTTPTRDIDKVILAARVVGR